MENFNKLFEEFNKMGLDAKRNAYNEEIIKISLILKEYLSKFDSNLLDEPYNYKSMVDSKLKESELLNISYRDIYLLKVELLMLLTYYDKKESEN